MSKYKFFKNAEYIDNGGWCDPELKYNDKLYNYYEIEDTIYDSFKNYCEEENVENNEENFLKYCEDNEEEFEEIFENATVIENIEED